MTTSETLSEGLGEESGHWKTMRPRSINERMIQLSQPKYLHIVPPLQITSQGPMVRWCTQDQLTPVSASALRAQASPRVRELATPKRNHQREKNRDLYSFSCGRSSALWHVNESALQGQASERVEDLSHPKSPPKEYLENVRQFKYSCGRSSPMWSAKRIPSATPRVMSLSRHKTVVDDYNAERMLPVEVATAAKSASASEIVTSLAQHKKRNPGLFREPMWVIPRETLKVTPSARVHELARAKGAPDGFNLNLVSPQWPVSRSARLATSTGRLNELATPINRPSMDHLLFDPNAFMVKDVALKAYCSNRIKELAEPVQR